VEGTRIVLTLRSMIVLGFGGLVVANLAGCSPRDGGPPRVPVEVEVVHKGVPAAEAEVVFSPVGGGSPAFGRTGTDGKTLLSTFGANDGALPGTYQVMVSKKRLVGGTQIPDDYDGPMPPPGYVEPEEVNELPKKYASFATSGLEATVTEGAGKNTFRFELTN
jgi:hypothetical protein